MSTLLKTGLAAVALSALLAACNDPVAAPEPANEGVAAEMPQTPDMGAAAEAASGSTPAAAGAAPAGAPGSPDAAGPGSAVNQPETPRAPAG